MPTLLASSIMPRTTLNLDASVMRELRRRSERERKSIGELASQLLARELRRQGEPQQARPFAWVSRDLGKPTVDLEDADALAALLERHRRRERPGLRLESGRARPRARPGAGGAPGGWPGDRLPLLADDHGLPAHRHPPLGASPASQPCRRHRQPQRLDGAHHVRTSGEEDGFWDLHLATRNDADRGNDVPDGHLAELMRQHGVGTIYTRDRDFRRFDGIVAEELFAGFPR